MLTKIDFKQIEKIVQIGTQKVVKKELGAVRTEFKNEIGSVKKDVSEIRSDMQKIVRKELGPIKKDITKIRSDIAIVSSFFDNEYLGLRSRVERIEHHIGFATA
ncbi:hypothetical protein KKG65_02960 [Patescibacteria group bacterium]|nr:hypothetical protein [Patescibacteria group bacterium]